MIEVLATRSRLNSDVAALTANIPQLVVHREFPLIVVDMTNMAVAVVGSFIAHRRMVLYATIIIDL